MEKKIKVKLSIDDLNNVIKDLKSLSKQFNTLNDTISKELAEATKYQLEQNYSMLPYVGSEGTPSFGVKVEGHSYKVYASGKSVIYEEFGTGDKGQSSPYPIPQSDFGLKGYNTGETIRRADRMSAEHGIKDGMYWTYWDGTKWVYTQGIPSGKFMYNTSEWLRSNYKDLIQKKVDDVISKV